MKIIHCADIHLGAPMSTLPPKIAAERKASVRDSFERMVSFAQSNGISVILLSGDVFDCKKPPRAALKFFYGIVRANPEVDFLYLRGNHDMADTPDGYPNLKIFSETWSEYSYGDVTVNGIELNDGNTENYYSALSLDRNKKNIVMLHGKVGDDVNLSRLKDKNIDYLALGHIHSYSADKLDHRGTYAYSGCLEGRGFDETGEKGFVILDTDGAGITHEFVPFSKRIIEKHHVDISELEDTYAVSKMIKDTVNPRDNGIYRIILNGSLTQAIPELETEVEDFLSRYCDGHFSVKNETAIRINYEDYANDLSLRGEFIRTVQASTEYTEEEKAVIINYGLKALTGEKII